MIAYCFNKSVIRGNEVKEIKKNLANLLRGTYGIVWPHLSSGVPDAQIGASAVRAKLRGSARASWLFFTFSTATCFKLTKELQYADVSHEA
jgi:hypothetical protein